MTATPEPGIDPEDPRAAITSRRLAWPPAAVFAAIADPARLARWWGPAGFRSSFEQFDFRPGGSWRFVLHGPDGRDYPNEMEFAAIAAPHRVVMRHRNGHLFELTITLEDDSAGGTRLGWRQRFESAEHCARVATIVVPANEQNLDRLEAELARGAPAEGAA